MHTYHFDASAMKGLSRSCSKASRACYLKSKRMQITLFSISPGIKCTHRPGTINFLVKTISTSRQNDALSIYQAYSISVQSAFTI